MNNIKLLYDLISNENIINKMILDLNVYISGENIMMALMDNYRLDWNYNEIKKQYLKSKEYKSSIKIYNLIEFDKSIISNTDNLIRYDECIKNNGQVWYIHKNDKDPFPSIPHAHNYDWHVSLHLGNGTYYQGRTMRGKIKRKHLVEIRNKVKNIDLPILV